jgi:hypothetical protein
LNLRRAWCRATKMLYNQKLDQEGLDSFRQSPLASMKPLALVSGRHIYDPDWISSHIRCK